MAGIIYSPSFNYVYKLQPMAKHKYASGPDFLPSTDALANEMWCCAGPGPSSPRVQPKHCPDHRTQAPSRCSYLQYLQYLHDFCADQLVIQMSAHVYGYVSSEVRARKQNEVLKERLHVGVRILPLFTHDHHESVSLAAPSSVSDDSMYGRKRRQGRDETKELLSFHRFCIQTISINDMCLFVTQYILECDLITHLTMCLRQA